MAHRIQCDGKMTNNHQGIIEVAKEVVKHAIRLAEVKKISLSWIRHAHGGRKAIKFRPISGGIKVIVRGSGGVQDLIVYTEFPSQVERSIAANFQRI